MGKPAWAQVAAAIYNKYLPQHEDEDGVRGGAGAQVLARIVK